MTHKLGTQISQHDCSLVKEREEEPDTRLDHPRPQEVRQHHHQHVIQPNQHHRCEDEPPTPPNKLGEYFEPFGQIRKERAQRLHECNEGITPCCRVYII